MVTVMVSLLTLGLFLSGTVMIGLLQRHLMSQVDTQLTTTATSMSQTTSPRTAPTSSVLPSLFYIRYELEGEEAQTAYSQDTLTYAGTPRIPTLLEIGELAETDSGWTQPVTVDSDIKDSPWRAIAVPLVRAGTTTPIGVLTVALPLTDVQHTLRNTALYVSTAGIVIVFVGGTAAHYLVRRSLSPLRAIESTAGKIAAGDLTQRITPKPSTTEVGSLALSLNTMLTRVEQSFAAREESERRIRRFVSDASHELRTPLAAISGYCELYSMGGVPQERTSEVMGRIQSESTRMGALVEDLLTLARLDEGRPLEFSEVDLVKMADNAVFDLQALDPTRNVALVSLSGRRPPMALVVRADRDRIQQVFTNIVGNAVRYTPKGSPVEIAVGTKGQVAVVEVRDHGPGISQQERERVFERFYRTENSRNRSLGGSGLGLAIVAGILGAHHGQAKLSRTSGGGLTVRIELPLIQAQAQRA
ncbi:HAMP domain-containing histidine kinase [Schaalia sp. 19OD2882]|uniref:sensor histidine kinase n=1 Tax=Schaalia sp. 19OD2882 TaxID=2794089 RepID=UPI001C1EA3B2|nr:HAMP domain-containing sensor histidine kinase [Schaalia sp. 19OD2882]QWW19906.1 HAMP domain-containing histidine kinase [Schaalia sp. 19OD2882]